MAVSVPVNAAPGGGVAKPGAPTVINRNSNTFRAACATPSLYWIAAGTWLAGACCLVAEEPRNGFVIGSGSFHGAGILFIISSCFFILATLTNFVHATQEAAAVRVNNVTPGLARLLVHSAGWEVLAAILLLIGSAIWLGGTIDTVSAGAIIWVIAGVLFLVGALGLTFVSISTASVSALMPDVAQRQRTWYAVASNLTYALGWVGWTIAACAMVVISGPGFMLFGGVVWIATSALWLFAFTTRGCGTYRYHTPTLWYATTAAAAGMSTNPYYNPTMAGAPKTVDVVDSKAGAPVAAAPVVQPAVVPAVAPATTVPA